MEFFKLVPIKVFFGDNPLIGAELHKAHSFMFNEVALCREHIEHRFETETKTFTNYFNAIADRPGLIPRNLMAELLNKMVPAKVCAQDMYDLACNLDSEGTGFI